MHLSTKASRAPPQNIKRNFPLFVSVVIIRTKSILKSHEHMYGMLTTLFDSAQCAGVSLLFSVECEVSICDPTHDTNRSNIPFGMSYCIWQFIIVYPQPINNRHFRFDLFSLSSLMTYFCRHNSLLMCALKNRSCQWISRICHTCHIFQRLSNFQLEKEFVHDALYYACAYMVSTDNNRKPV